MAKYTRQEIDSIDRAIAAYNLTQHEFEIDFLFLFVYLTAINQEKRNNYNMHKRRRVRGAHYRCDCPQCSDRSPF